MSSALLSIGGLALLLEGDESVGKAMELPGVAVFAIQGDVTPNICFVLDTAAPQAPARELHSFAVMDGSGVCRFCVDADGVYQYRFSANESVSFDPRHPSKATITPMSSPSLLRFALWLAYSMTGVAYGRMPVHASTVVCERCAVLCLGESGTGKSTHTRLWLQNIPHTHLLNDDSPIVAARRDAPALVYGSPWSGKTHCYRQEHYPIAALLRLEQRPENIIRRLSTLEAFAALQPSCPPSMAHDEHCLNVVVQLVSAVLTHTPAFRLGCLPDADAALLSHSTIYSQPL